LRAALRKPEDTRQNFINFTRAEFRKNAELDKKDFAAIEHLLRRGQRQLEIYESASIRNIH
jgi:succinate dehydrogenase assembly factor 1